MIMSKQLIFHTLLDEDYRPALERWYRRYHGPEVAVKQPWLIRYDMYRPVPSPDGADGFCPINYRLHENWALDNSMRRGPEGLLSMTPFPGPNVLDVAVVTIPAQPTEDFLGADLRFDDSSILRWVVAISYPEGVDPEEADAWYVNTHAPEVMQQKGLIRFFSTRAFPDQSNPFRQSKKQQDFKAKEAKPRIFRRVSELWYANNAAWRKAVIEEPVRYTVPSWAQTDVYPFLAPHSNLVSAFILESPDQDMLSAFKPLYY